MCVAVHINYKSAIAENATHIGLNMKGNVLVHSVHAERTGNTRLQSRLYPATQVNTEYPVAFFPPLCLPQLVFP